jgi:2-oxoglutarate ferredoxin oxidoreductase subunit beta
MLASLATPAYITRQTLISPKYINRAKKAIKKAFICQLENRCFSLVELISTCPTNWGMTPLNALKWAEEKMLPYFKLGDYKSPEED